MLVFTAERIYNPALIVPIHVIEQSARDEVIRAAREQGYYFPDGIDITHVDHIVPKNPDEPLPPDLIGIRARGFGVARPHRHA